MFGISMWELILIFSIALIIIGPEKLPDLAKKTGRIIGELKRAVSDLKESVDLEDNITNIKNTVNDFNMNIEKNENKVKKNNKEI